MRIALIIAVVALAAASCSSEPEEVVVVDSAPEAEATPADTEPAAPTTEPVAEVSGPVPTMPEAMAAEWLDASFNGDQAEADRIYLEWVDSLSPAEQAALAAEFEQLEDQP